MEKVGDLRLRNNDVPWKKGRRPQGIPPGTFRAATLFLTLTLSSAAGPGSSSGSRNRMRGMPSSPHETSRTKPGYRSYPRWKTTSAHVNWLALNRSQPWPPSTRSTSARSSAAPPCPRWSSNWSPPANRTARAVVTSSSSALSSAALLPPAPARSSTSPQRKSTHGSAASRFRPCRGIPCSSP